MAEKYNTIIREDINLKPLDPSSVIKTTPLFEKSFAKLKLSNKDLEELKSLL